MGLASWKARGEELEAEVYALALAARDGRTPVAAKGVVVMTVAYALSPIDPLPDFVPVIGYLDELVVLPLGVSLARRLVPDDVLAECRCADEDVDIGRARWVVAALTVLAWVGVGLFVLRALW